MRLAGVSALLTFVILCAFALAIGSITVERLRSDFNRDVRDSALELPKRLHVTVEPVHNTFAIDPPLQDLAGDHAVIRIMALEGNVIAQWPHDAPSFGSPLHETEMVRGYRVVTQEVAGVLPDGERLGRLILQYARPVADTEATVKRVELSLLLGVLFGSGLALMAGMAIARRAMAGSLRSPRRPPRSRARAILR